MLLAGIAMLFATSVYGAPQASAATITPDPAVPSTDLRPFLAVYHDAGGGMTLDQVLAAGDAGAFAPLTGDTLSGRFTPSTDWLRLQLAGPADADTQWALVAGKPSLLEVDYYLLDEDGTLLDEAKTGALRPFATRPLPGEDFVFPVDLPAGERRTILLRVVDSLAAASRLELLAPSAQMARANTRQLTQGAIYGALLIMAAYHLLLYAMLRQRSYLLLSLFSVAVTATYVAASGHGQRYLWPDHPQVLLWIVPLSIGLTGLFLLLLTMELLETRRRAPDLHWIMVALAAGIAATLLLVPFAPIGTLLAVHYALLAPALLVTALAALVVWRRGYTPARYFAVAQLIPLTIGLVTIVAPLVGAPLPPETREYSIPGNILMVLFTSFALADRINLVQTEKEQALRDLKASEQRMAQYLEAMPAGVAVFKPDLSLIYVNKAALALADNPEGPPTTSLNTARTVYQFFHRDSDEPYTEEDLPLLRALRGESFSVDDADMVTSRRRFPVAMWASPVLDTHGNVEYAITVFQDISPIHEAQDRLTAAQALYQRVVEDQPSLICRFQPDGAVTFANTAFARFFGYEVAGVLGQNVFDFAGDAEERASQHSRLAALSKEEPVLTSEYEIPAADGRQHWMRWIVRALFDRQSSVSEYQMLGLDMTETRQAEQELSEYRNHLENLVATRTRDLSQAITDLERRAEELAALNTITASLASARDVQAQLSEVAGVVQRLFRASTTSISLFDEHSIRLTAGGTTPDAGKAQPPVSNGEPVDLDPILLQMAETRRTLIVERPADSPHDEAAHDVAAHGEAAPDDTAHSEAAYNETARTRHAEPGVHGTLCVPLLARGELVGALILSTMERNRRFTQAEVELAETIAGPLAAAIETSVLLRREQRQRAMAESLQQVAQALNSSLELEVVLREVLEQLGHVMAYDSAALFLGEGNALVVAAATGPSADAAQGFPPSNGQSLAARVFAEHQPLEAHLPAGPDTPPMIWLGAPLLVGSDAIGVLSVMTSPDHPEEFTPLQAFADHAAIAVLNARLFQQTQIVASSRERERLARDLHDAVTQTLFSASILAEALPAQWEVSPEGALVTLEKLRHLTRGALAEMRTLLLELRPGALTEVGLDSLLRHLGDALTGSTLVPVFLTIEATDLHLPSDIQVAFYRIAQEALNNVAKHADASAVEITLKGGPSEVTLQLRDDGRGFDLESIAPGHLGLTIMRERAASVGGTLAVESALGQGTRLTLRWCAPALRR